MCFFIVMEIGNSNNPPFTPLDPESGIRDPDPFFFAGWIRIRKKITGSETLITVFYFKKILISYTEKKRSQYSGL